MKEHSNNELILLPNELLYKIISFLKFGDLAPLSIVCNSMNKIIEEIPLHMEYQSSPLVGAKIPVIKTYGEHISFFKMVSRNTNTEINELDNEIFFLRNFQNGIREIGSAANSFKDIFSRSRFKISLSMMPLLLLNYLTFCIKIYNAWSVIESCESKKNLALSKGIFLVLPEGCEYNHQIGRNFGDNTYSLQANRRDPYSTETHGGLHLIINDALLACGALIFFAPMLAPILDMLDLKVTQRIESYIDHLIEKRNLEINQIKNEIKEIQETDIKIAY